MIIGGISGAATFGIGELFKTGGLLANMSSETAQIFTQAVLHGVSQGFMGLLDGGNFFQGFISAINIVINTGSSKKTPFFYKNPNLLLNGVLLLTLPLLSFIVSIIVDLGFGF